MKRFYSAVLVTLFGAGLTCPLRADEREATAILDKAIKALGGEEKLGKIEVFIWKGRSKYTLAGHKGEFTGQATFQGLDHFRAEAEGELNGKPYKGVRVINGSKGWEKYGDMKTKEMDEKAVANWKRNIYLQLVPITLVPLKSKGFKIDSAGEDKVGDKAAVGIRATGPDGKDFKIYFDRESGLPVKLVAQVVGPNGKEHEMEQTYADYKDFAGIKKFTTVESKDEGKVVSKREITEFKVLDKDKVPADTFAEPK
jgi:hypothetical protein